MVLLSLIRNLKEMQLTRDAFNDALIQLQDFQDESKSLSSRVQESLVLYLVIALLDWPTDVDG